MATELLATGNTAASSSDFEVETATTIALKGFHGPTARIDIEIKDDAGAYHRVGGLDSEDIAIVVAAPGTYRVTRIAGAACGVFSG